MGLFDKLKNAIDTATDTINKAIESVQGENVSNQNTPPLDEIVKNYYEIIYWMKGNLSWYGKETTDENSRARKYIELMIGEPCDEEKFITAVEMTNMGTINTPKTILEKQIKDLKEKLSSELKAIIDKRKEGLSEEADSLYKYKCETEKAYRVCYENLISQIKADYDMILDVIKDNVNCEHFIQGFNKRILEKYEKDYFEHLDICVYIVISDSFFEGNPVTKELLFYFFVDTLNNRFNNPSSKEYVAKGSLIYSLALRAVHFENCSEGEYTPISHDECKKFVLNCPAYIKKIEDHPFEKEEYIEKFANNVRTAYSFEPGFSSFEEYDEYISSYHHSALTWAKCSKNYFNDALANFFWKEIAEEFTETTDENGVIMGESKDAMVVANMIHDYIKED